MAYVTGFSGRFPSSESVSAFWNNLCNGKDLVSTTERYPADYHGLPGRQAEIGPISKFDSMFFGISASQADCLDPQIRLLLESVFEAVVDAGYSMADLAGSNTGVYVGGCFSDLHKAMLKDIRSINGYENTGCSHSMFSNRVSFCFNFTGPSMTVDTACSSSLVAFDTAVRDIRSGRVSRAIVGGVSVVMDPGISKSFHAYNMLSPTGKCHSFDDRADGYVRADAIGAVLLEADTLVNSGYMRVLGTGVNSDGWKSAGITFPSADQQIVLCQSVCKEYNIDPAQVGYVEAHGTGTTAGDRQELRAIDTVYGSANGAATTNSATLIGSVKSNMGHSEGASGAMALVKSLMVLAEDTIPGNLHYKSTSHEPIVAGRLAVVDSTRPFYQRENTGGALLAINNFGFGGTNASVVGTKGHSSVTDPAIPTAPTRWVFGRTQANLEQYVAKKDLGGAAWGKMMRSSSATDKFPFRGVVTGEESALELTIRQAPAEKVHIAFCYSGQGCQWSGMGKDLWSDPQYPTFRSTIEAACEGLDLGDNITADKLFTEGTVWMESKWSGLGITLVQLGLTAMLKEAGVEPDYIFGHSVGEVACGYADGCTSAKEAARIALVRCTLAGKIRSEGLMLAAGLGYEDALETLASFPNTTVACYNSPDGVTLSGPEADINAIQADLSAKGVFARLVPTDGVAYHSTFFKQNVDKIETELGRAIQDTPKLRSPKWLSTSSSTNSLAGMASTNSLIGMVGAQSTASLADLASVDENRSSGGTVSDVNIDIDINVVESESVDITLPTVSPYPDAAYHAGNVAGMVNFAPVVASLPAGTIVLEVGPHALLKSIIKRCNAGVTSIPVMIKGKSGAEVFASCLDSLWLGGAQFAFKKENYVVPPSQRIQVLWDHDKDWKICDWKSFASSAATTVSYNLAGKDSYMMDHRIDGRSLFPAMGHVYTAWQASPTGLARPLELINFKILRAIILDGVAVSFSVRLEGRQWIISHEGEPVATGEYSEAMIAADSESLVGQYMPCAEAAEAAVTTVQTESVEGVQMYRSLARFGYEYQPEFQLVQSHSADGQVYRLRPTDHWTAYLDNVLQASVCQQEVTGLRLPTQIDSITIRQCDINAAGLDVVVSRPLIGVVGNAAVTVRGLHTTATSKVYKPAVMRALEFVPYGEHTYTYKESYKLRTLQQLADCFWAVYNSTEGYKEKYSFLHRIAAIAPPASGQPPLIVGAVLPNEQLASVTEHVYADPVEAMQRSYFRISTAPGHDDLYALDASSSCFGAVQAGGLDLMAQIIRGNVNVAGTASGDGKFSVLELGAGSGGLTRNLYPLVQGDVDRYIATDISNIKPVSAHIECVRYDLNEKWEGDKVHVVAASNAAHTGRSLKNVLGNIHNALADGGFLLLHEYISVLPVLLWGLSDFAWAAEDGDEREFALWISQERWMTLLPECGFRPVVWFLDEAKHQMLMLAQKINLAPASSESVPVVVTRNALVANAKQTLRSADFGDLGFVRCLRKEPSYETVRLQLLLSANSKNADADTDAAVPDACCVELPIAVYSAAERRWGGIHEVSLSTTTKSSAVAAAATTTATAVIGRHAEVASPGNLDSLHWVQNLHPSVYKVSFCGLNFKDAMLAFGRLTSPGAVQLGLEFSGTRLTDGARVMGISSGCMADSLYAAEHVVWELPTTGPAAKLTLEDAATIPVVYATVLYALVSKANVQKGQTVLIHSIAGGVGQAALNVCRHRGANVIVTCSPEKAAWVSEHLNIPRNHVLDSHSLSFRDEVLTLTAGAGVDIVLNSLSGEKLIASVACLASYGHFCEIGKYDIQQNSPVGLGLLERNISLHCIDLSDMFDRPKVWAPVHKLVQEGLMSGEIQPLRTTVFADVEQGLRHISAGKHIGKVLVDMQQVTAAITKTSSTNDEDAATVTTTSSLTSGEVASSFRTSGTHLVVGGLGGFGLEMVSFLHQYGAKRVIIVSRGEPQVWQRSRLARCNASVVHTDLTNAEQCDQLVASLGASLVGVWHLGMVLNDRLYSNMTEQAWDQTVRVKADICQHLDTSTRAHCPKLEQFVMWSSVSALFGNAGQTNYAYANGAMEHVCMTRKEDGLCGLAIQWGLIGAVGVMVGKSTNSDFAFQPQHIDNCLEALHSTLLVASQQHAVVTSYVRTDRDATLGAAGADGTAELDLATRVARVLGVDPTKVRGTDTLSALGMDSLQSVEVIGILKKKGVTKTQPELQAMPWSALEELC